MNRFFTLFLAASCLNAVGQGANLCEYPELLVQRVVFLDADSDGVWLYAQSDDPLIWDSGPTGDSLFVQECGTYDVRELVEIEGLGQLPCGFSEEVLVLTEDCLGSELEFFCGDGTVYDVESGKCIVANPSDSNFDGCVQLNDLLDLLSAYGDCGAEESAWQCGDPLEYQGYDYETVQIGEQCWFAENLRAENYRNGEAIPAGLSNSEWAETAEGAVSVYDEDMTNLSTYGRLYNWYAVDDHRALCPLSWKIATNQEWSVVVESVASDQDLIGQDWIDVGTNTSGFSLLPGGKRDYVGEFAYESENGYYWTSTEAYNNSSFHVLVGTGGLSEGNNLQNDGMSIRCIKDTE